VIKLYSPEHLHLLITFGLLILIWIVQILHYPSFYFYDENKFSKAMLFHQRAISYVTLPLMVSELILVTLIFSNSPNFFHLLSIIIVGIIWLSTFLIQVPLHKKLLLSKDNRLIKKLINTNWIRTGAWSIKFILLSWNYL